MDDNNNNGFAGNPLWRSQLPADARLRIVNKILETLRRHLPILCPAGLLEVMKIAVRFEDKIYTNAFSQSDYLRIISMKMLAMETRNPGAAYVLEQSHPELQNSGTSWQTHFTADDRLRIFNEILNTSRKYLPMTSIMDLLEATVSAVTFEEQIYTSANDQSDYLSKIALKMLSMEVNSQNSDVHTPLPQSAVIIN